MRVFLRFTRLVFILCAAAFAQMQTPGTLPTDSLKGHWKFDDADNLNLATVGVDLVQEHVTPGGTIKITAIDGPNGSGAVNIEAGSFFRATHNSGANDAVNDTLTNQYTIVMDARYPDLTAYRVFYNAKNDPADDGDIFANTSGGIGGGSAIGGYSAYGVTDGGWFRVTFVADLGNSYKIYLDGQLIIEASQGFEADGRMALNPQEFLIAQDNDGEDNPIDIAEVAVYNRALTEQEITDMGGYAHYALATKTVGLWEMNKADSLDFASTGEDITVTGSQTAVQDTFRLGYTNLAAALESGTSYTINHGLQTVPEGFYGHGTKVNYYSLILDVRFPALGVSYELIPGLSVNAEGKIGSDVLGWSDFKVKAEEWYRVAVSVSLDNPNISDVAVWVDSDPVLTKDGLAADSDMGFDATTVQLFTDGNPIDVSNVKLYNTALPYSTVDGLGGYKHSVMATGGIEIRAQQDAYVRGGSNGDKNYNEYRLLVRRSKTDDQSYERHPYLLFDLSSVTEAITSARLRLVTQFVGGDQKGVMRNTVAFYKISDDTWLDSTITWNTAPAFGDLLVEDLDVPRNGPKRVEPFNVYEYDVTAYVQDEVNLGDYLVSFAASAPELGADIRFFSNESADKYADLKEWQKPTLVINGNVTAIGNEAGFNPQDYELKQNYPNPFNPQTTIEFRLAVASKVNISVYNVLGQQVVKLVDNKPMQMGKHFISWKPNNTASGVYFYKIEAGDFVQVRKMMLLK